MSCDTLNEIKAFNCSKKALQTYDSNHYNKYDLNLKNYTTLPYLNDDNDGINLIMDNCNIYPYTVCINGNNNNYYKNCGLSTGSPWFSLNKITGKCVPNIDALSKSLISTNDVLTSDCSFTLRYIFKSKNKRCKM